MLGNRLSVSKNTIGFGSNATVIDMYILCGIFARLVLQNVGKIKNHADRLLLQSFNLVVKDVIPSINSICSNVL